MTPIDQVKPPASMPPSTRVQRKKRSTRDSNQQQKPKQNESSKDKGRGRSEHIDKLI